MRPHAALQSLSLLLSELKIESNNPEAFWRNRSGTVSSAGSAFEKVQVGATALLCCTGLRFLCVLLNTPEPLLFSLSQNGVQLTELQRKWQQKLGGTFPFLSCSWRWRLDSCFNWCLSNLSTPLRSCEETGVELCPVQVQLLKKFKLVRQLCCAAPVYASSACS